MRKLLIILLLIAAPSSALAEASLTKYPVGTCRKIDGFSGFYQQMSDGTWAAPSDRLNTCETDGFNNPIIPGWNSWPRELSYNPSLANMTYSEWLINCVLSQSFIPRPECQGYNPYFGRYADSSNWLQNLLNYPRFGREFADNSSGKSKNMWRDVLIGAGMGWLFNRLTS